MTIPKHSLETSSEGAARNHYTFQQNETRSAADRAWHCTLPAQKKWTFVRMKSGLTRSRVASSRAQTFIWAPAEGLTWTPPGRPQFQIYKVVFIVFAAKATLQSFNFKLVSSGSKNTRTLYIWTLAVGAFWPPYATVSSLRAPTYVYIWASAEKLRWIPLWFQEQQYKTININSGLSKLISSIKEGVR